MELVAKVHQISNNHVHQISNNNNRMQKSIKLPGAKLWNSLPISLKQSSYHKLIKKHKELRFANYDLL